MKTKNAKDKTLSHNVYSDKTNYRIRIYRNDNKFFEKQLKLPKLEYFSFDEMILHVLCKFADKIAEDSHKKDTTTEYFDDFVKAMNKCFLLADYLHQTKGLVRLGNIIPGELKK